MLVLFECPVGLALLKVTDTDLVQGTSADIPEILPGGCITVKKFQPFETLAIATEVSVAILNNEAHPDLLKLLKSVDSSVYLVSKQLARSCKENDIKAKYHIGVARVHKAIRPTMKLYLDSESANLYDQFSLCLGHSLSRACLQSVPERADHMINSSISMLLELDRDINSFAMKLREWYSFHFPELTLLVSDLEQYLSALLIIKTRDRVSSLVSELEPFLGEEVTAKLVKASQTSTGSEIGADDQTALLALATRLKHMCAYRRNLNFYMEKRMNQVAPNLTQLIGPVIGARLICASGSLSSLASSPSSTIQLLGAEKSLFRALKARKRTPKYGLIFNSSLVGRASAVHKGRVARTLSGKLALAARIDGYAVERDTEGLSGRRMRETLDKVVEQLNNRKPSHMRGTRRNISSSAPRSQNNMPRKVYTPQTSNFTART